MKSTELRLEGEAPFRILQLSDCHLLERAGQTMMGVDTELSLREVLRHLLSHPLWPPELILLTGDLVQDPFEDSYRRLRHIMDNLAVPWVCLPGNHYSPALMDAILCRHENHCARHILFPPWQLVCLNSHKENSHQGHLLRKELDFLAQSLTAGDGRPALIALHHPPVPVGSAWMDTMRLDNGEELLTLLSNFSQVKAVIFGHVHQTFSTHYQSIPLWSVPSTCFQFKPHSETFALDSLPPGWRWLELHPDGKIETWVERLENPPAGLDFHSEGY